MQDLCRSNLAWDESLKTKQAARWNAWLNELTKILQVNIERCVKPPNNEIIVSTQLHNFADASQSGYGAVSYLRFEDAKGNIHCSYVMGKSSVATIKETTIPQQELSAAVVATRLNRIIRNESDAQIDKSLFWTDTSTSVLSYLSSTSRRFKTFVTNRVATIRETSSPSQWPHINSVQNPDDDAPRGLSAEALLKNQRWLRGPEFLWNSEDCWPCHIGTLPTIGDNDPEVKTDVQTFVIVNSSHITMDGIIHRFSSWMKLKKCVAWLLRLCRNLQQKIRRDDNIISTESVLMKTVKPLTVFEMECGKREIVKFVQSRSFQEEISSLMNSDVPKSTTTPTMKKSSAIYKLDPRLRDGLVCVGGHLMNAHIPEESKHPVIIPRNSGISDLIARHFHQVAGHSGLEHVLSLIRERFWLIGARHNK